jgi:hypothetical protein
MIGFLTDLVCKAIIAPIDHMEDTHRMADAVRRQTYRKQKRKKKYPWHCCGDDCNAVNEMPYKPETNNGWILKLWQTVPSRRGWMCAECAEKYPEGE